MAVFQMRGKKIVLIGRLHFQGQQNGPMWDVPWHDACRHDPKGSPAWSPGKSICSGLLFKTWAYIPICSPLSEGK
jgi:hypothetical protein